MCIKFVDMVRAVCNEWDEPEVTIRYVEALERFNIVDCDPCKSNLYKLMFESPRSVLFVLLLPLSEGVFREKLTGKLKEWEIDEMWELFDYGKGLVNADMVDIEGAIMRRLT